MGELFDMEVSKVNEWIHHLLPMLREALDELGVMPERDARAVAQAQAQRRAGRTMILDGTERQTTRVTYLSPTYAGTAHDKRIADHEQIVYAPDTILYQDTGFQGYRPAVTRLRQPKKKPRGRELTAQQKRRNQSLARVRVRVEHSLN